MANKQKHDTVSDTNTQEKSRNKILVIGDWVVDDNWGRKWDGTEMGNSLVPPMQYTGLP